MNQHPQFDLHTHSSCSDGSLAPSALVAHAAAAGVGVLALTDHDTVAGLEEAGQAARQAKVIFVPGIELSAAWRTQSIHVLGLWLDPACKPLAARLAAQAERRRSRLRAICRRLDGLGLPGSRLGAAIDEQTRVPTRTHLAQALVADGHARNLKQAFKRYLGRGGPAHVAAGWPPLEEIVGWITEAGGVACLAHPGRYALSSGARRQLLEAFKEAGGAALEVVAGAHGGPYIESAATLAVQYGLQASVGSDFHGPAQIWNPLGRLAKLPDCVVPIWRAHGL